MTRGRFVWLTREQREAMRALMMGERSDTWQILAPIVNWWDAAPADATEAAFQAMTDKKIASGWILSPDHASALIPGVLRALGVPETRTP